MKRLSLLIISATILIQSCCPKVIPQISNTLDSVRVVRDTKYIEKIRDTTIYVYVPAEVKEADGRRDSSLLETSVARSLARINPDGTLFHNLENKQVSIPVVVNVKDKELFQRQDSIVYRDKYVVDTIVEKHTPKSYWWFMGISILAIGLGLWRIFTAIKGKIKFTI